jgi:plastocyanin
MRRALAFLAIMGRSAAVSCGGGPSSPVQSAGRFSRAFPTAGSYTYFCSVHGRAVMSGIVVVH